MFNVLSRVFKNQVNDIAHIIRQSLVLFCLFLCLSGQSHAAWFQASGQAVIVNGDKSLARQQATQEAIKQALLFAGASVTSVQQLTNGLLKDDRLEVRATGEVNAIELIDEIYHSDYITVSIRADIFPQESRCSASDYKKTLVTAHMPFTNSAQTKDGNLSALSAAAMARLPDIFSLIAPQVMIKEIVDEKYNWESSSVQDQVHELARKADAQYVLAITALDVSVNRPESSLAFWRDSSAERTFAIRIRVFDGMSAKLVLDTTRSTTAPWPLDRFSSVDVYSAAFWQSSYGKVITTSFESAIEEINDTLSCKEAVGRVLNVANNQLQINLGEEHHVKRGDSLYLYQTRQLIDPFGQSYLQHVLHPTKVIVSDVYASTATVTSTDGSLLANIQPNDFVAKR